MQVRDAAVHERAHDVVDVARHDRTDSDEHRARAVAALDRERRCTREPDDRAPEHRKHGHDGGRDTPEERVGQAGDGEA